MPVIKMLTIIVLIALMTMEEMLEVSSTSFAMEEPTRMTRLILNNNNKSSTKFFMKENNKDEGVSCLDGLYDVTRKEENVLRKKNKGNSEIKNQSQRRKSGGKNRTRKEDSLSLSQICVGVYTHNPFHFTYCILWQVVVHLNLHHSNYEWRGMQGPSSPKFLNRSESPFPFLFYKRGGYFGPLVGGWRQWENKEERRE